MTNTTNEIAARNAARTQENRRIVSEMGASVKPLLEDEEQANADITFLLAEVERLRAVCESVAAYHTPLEAIPGMIWTDNVIFKAAHDALEGKG